MKTLKILCVASFMGLVLTSCENEGTEINETNEVTTVADDSNPELAAKAKQCYYDRSDLGTQNWLSCGWAHYYIDNKWVGWCRGMYRGNCGK